MDMDPDRLGLSLDAFRVLFCIVYSGVDSSINGK
jgi:hypothetical protein